MAVLHCPLSPTSNFFFSVVGGLNYPQFSAKLGTVSPLCSTCGSLMSCRCCCVFQSWSGPEKLLALDELIDSCEPTQVKHMMQVIEPQFQRDFISLLPKEVRPPSGHPPPPPLSLSIPLVPRHHFKPHLSHQPPPDPHSARSTPLHLPFTHTLSLRLGF